MRSRLFLKAFTTIVLAVLVFTAISYLATVPYIRHTVQEQDERAGRVVLDNIHELLRLSHFHIEAWRESALQARRRELRRVVDLARATIRQIERQSQAQGLSPEATQKRILDSVRKLTYGRQDYVFIADYDYRLISHPDPELHKADFSQTQGAHGNLIVPPMVDGAIEHGEGFHTYWWSRLNDDEPAPKLSYYEHMPEHDWVIGTGVYVDDVEAVVEKRRQKVTERLRRYLHDTRIARTGYLYVFDDELNMIIHPDQTLEGSNFSDMKNPASGESIGKELIAAAHSQENRLKYKWDRPSDPGNYVYDKIAWVRKVPERDWYVASSVYISEFRDTANSLTWRILIVAAAVLLATLLLAYGFLRRLTKPISELADTALRAGQGDLTAKTEISRDDEIGTLAETLNTTIDRLRDQIQHMEQRVNERTCELSRSVQDLERRNHESAVMNQMSELLRSCHSEREVFTVIANSLQELYPHDDGRAYIRVGESLKLVSSWGTPPTLTDINDSQSCWAVRRAAIHHDPITTSESLCPHCHEPGLSVCVPLLAEGGMIGVVKLNAELSGDDDTEEAITLRESLCSSVAKQAALSITNLYLHERLRQQSIRDFLTGLLNRRRLEEDLSQELARAKRRNTRVAVVMLDIDNFKELNDTHGHEAGDEVLRELARVIQDELREDDKAYRYGGEEFTLTLSDTDEQGAQSLAERIRTLSEQNIASLVGLPQAVTVSLGIAFSTRHAATPTELIRAADQALYTAKGLGRNRIFTA